MDILKNITEKLSGEVTEATFEGANIVIYTENEKFFKEGESKIKKIVDEIKKRIELRADSKILLEQEKTKAKIKEIVPKEAEITNIIFDPQRSIVIIEAKKPGLVIGKQGSILGEIRKSTLWVPQIQRSPAIKSQITENIREVLYANNNYRRRFLNSIGKKIYTDWDPSKKEEWVRLVFLGGARQVGRSCILLQTPHSKVLLDCGVDIASSGQEKFPVLDVPEFDITQLDAIILSHAHLDHCLPPSYPVLTKKGYKPIDEIKEGDVLVSMDWKTGRYIKDKCSQKTRTFGHTKILKIKTHYSTIESSPNHRFFTFKNLELKELEAKDLSKGMLLPSNLVNKPAFGEKRIILDTNIEYGKRREDKVILPKVLTPKLIEFIGYYMGDGHKSSDFSLRLTDNSKQILEHHKEIVKDIFNYKGKIKHHTDKTKNAYILEINNVKLIRFLEKNFPEALLKSRNINVPEKVKRSSLNIQNAFLRGFSDAEGTVTNIVKVCTYSKKMLEDLQYLFSMQGIPSNIKNDNTICINSHFGINQFLKKIGFSLKYKQGRLNKLARDKPFTKQNLLPFTPSDLRKILKDAGMLGRVHNSPKLARILPMCLLDLFRRKQGYATRKTVEIFVNLLKQRINNLENIYINSGAMALKQLRQLLTITRSEISYNTGLQIHEIQTVEEGAYIEAFAQILGSFLREKLSSTILQTQKNLQVLISLLNMHVVWEKISHIEKISNPYKYLVDIEVEKNHNFVAGNLIVHNCGLIPYLYKMGYKGPLYLTPPTRDIAALSALDFIGVAYKQAEKPLFSSTDVKEMVKHSICLNFNEVTDVTPDVRLTFYNSGHVLGGAMVHLNIGNGSHNLLYTADFKYTKTRLLDPAITNFPRIESVITESTYGSKDDVLPPRATSEEELIEAIKKTIDRKGKVLIPELGLGRSQESMLVLEEAMKSGKIPKVPVYIDGMIWDINAIHTAYPDFLSNRVKSQIFQDKNPFVSDIFSRVGSPQERKKVIEGGPCIVLATSGMLVGGSSVEYFKNFAGNKKNSIVFVCYQGVGSLGRQIQEGFKDVKMIVDGKEEMIKVELEVHTLVGFSAHAGRSELIGFFNNMRPKPKRIIINHGEVSKSLDLASALYKLNRVETNVPRALESIRLR
ncbi:MAG: LAGLIDADG family homing endonuclease [archaeon]